MDLEDRYNGWKDEAVMTIAMENKVSKWFQGTVCTGSITW